MKSNQIKPTLFQKTSITLKENTLPRKRGDMSPDSILLTSG